MPGSNRLSGVSTRPAACVTLQSQQLQLLRSQGGSREHRHVLGGSGAGRPHAQQVSGWGRRRSCPPAALFPTSAPAPALLSTCRASSISRKADFLCLTAKCVKHWKRQCCGGSCPGKHQETHRTFAALRDGELVKQGSRHPAPRRSHGNDYKILKDPERKSMNTWILIYLEVPDFLLIEKDVRRPPPPMPPPAAGAGTGELASWAEGTDRGSRLSGHVPSKPPCSLSPSK